MENKFSTFYSGSFADRPSKCKGINMKNKTKLAVLLLLLVLVLVFSGCGKSKKDSEGKKKIAANFYLQSADDFTVVYEEDFEENYYDKSELEKMIDEEIAEFNTNYAVAGSDGEKKGIEKSSFEVADKKAVLKLRFHSWNDYITYSNEYISGTRNAKLFIGSYNDALAAGYTFPGKFTSPDKKESFDLESVTDDMIVIYTNEGFNMDIEGEIIAINNDVTIKDGLVSTFSARQNCIVYKK